MLRELRVQISAITAQLRPSVDCSGVSMAHDKMSAALAATPAVAPVVPADWVPCVVTHEGQHPEEVAYGPQIMMDRLKKWLERYFELKAATPVVLPEPVGWRHSRTLTLHETEQEVQLADGDSHAQPLFTEQQLRALLATATGLTAQAVEPSDAELIALNAGECFFSESPTKYPELGHGTQYHGGAPGVIGFARAALELRADPAAHSQKFQQRVHPWMMACFGTEISADRIERNHRFLEEALELVQSCGCTASEAHQLVDYVYGRPWGEPAQEAGGVMVTLAALCLANGLDMHACGETELARIWTKVEAIRAKQAAKPKHSPLPEHAPQAQADARDADGMYYLQDARHSAMVGNCPSFWRPGGNGYTTNLDEAERFTFEDAMKQHRCRETDLPWLCSEVDKLRRPTVDCQYMPRSWDAQRESIAAIAAAKGEAQ
ncbi:hypothetical protein N5D77_18165 [Comamonas thiooxydans]|nr:hypothetical protein [Comamonas thiooxydans]MDH1788499.1 hypothetical protein [Comamonas thiooxydans]